MTGGYRTSQIGVHVIHKIRLRESSLDIVVMQARTSCADPSSGFRNLPPPMMLFLKDRDILGSP